MASLISSRDSAERCNNLARRHQRLTKKVVNDAELSSQITPVMDQCKAKIDLLNQKSEAREDAYDDLALADKSLDDSIRSIYGDCEKFDRDNPAAIVLSKIFPDEKFGKMVRLPFTTEISAAEQMELRLESLGAEHPLHPNVALLHGKIEEGKNAISGKNNAIREEKMAEAEVDIDKEALIRQYENNYLDARKKYGKRVAEKLFPETRTRKSPVATEELDESAGTDT